MSNFRTASAECLSILKMTAVDALRMRCHTRCSRARPASSSIARLRLHYWPAMPHALQLGPVFLDAHRADPQSVDVPNTRAIVTFYSGAPVLPCRRHQCTPPCHELTPALSRWREASRRDAGMARRSAPWKAQGCRTFPSTAKFRRFLRTGGGSQLGADRLLCCTQYNSPVPMLRRLL